MGRALGSIIIGSCTGSAEADGFQGATRPGTHRSPSGVHAGLALTPLEPICLGASWRMPERSQRPRTREGGRVRGGQREAGYGFGRAARRPPGRVAPRTRPPSRVRHRRVGALQRAPQVTNALGRDS